MFVCLSVCLFIGVFVACQALKGGSKFPLPLRVILCILNAGLKKTQQMDLVHLVNVSCLLEIGCGRIA